MTRLHRRLTGLSLWLLASLAALGLNYALTVQLHHAAFYSGATLLVVLVMLTFFNARKKLPFLPLWRAATWLQIHIYLGWLAVVLFGLHLHWQVPRGNLEITLALLFVTVAGSGILGLALSRWLPPRLTMHGEPVIYERIPALRTVVRQRVEALVEQSVANTQSTTLMEFYEAKLQAYFAGPRQLWSHLLGFNKISLRLQAEAAAQDRYLNAGERELMAQIVELIQVKDNLDCQLAGQRVLKYWLFVHIPLTYGLLLLALWHALLALNFA